MVPVTNGRLSSSNIIIQHWRPAVKHGRLYSIQIFHVASKGGIITDNNYWKNWNRQGKYEKEQELLISDFLDKNIDSPLILDMIRNTQDWLDIIYPKIHDLDEASERDISAFIAGIMFCTSIANSESSGIRWIHYCPPKEDE